MISSLQLYKTEAKHAAKDLCYPEHVIDDIRYANTEEEIRRIMETARHQAIDKDMEVFDVQSDNR